MINGIKIEICVGNIDDVVRLQSFNIDRIELNSAIELGGLTPSLNTLLETKKLTKVPVMCMVRNRPAGFVYTKESKELMLKDAKLLLDNGADGIVFGFLNSDLTIDEEYTSKMITLIREYHKEVVFHKAFDLTPNKDEAIQTLISLGVDRILSDGASNSEIVKGVPLLKHLNDVYGKRIEILPGGGLRKDNILEVLNKTGIKQIHMTSKKKYIDSGEYYGLDSNELESVLNVVKSSSN